MGGEQVLVNQVPKSTQCSWQIVLEGTPLERMLGTFFGGGFFVKKEK